MSSIGENKENPVKKYIEFKPEEKRFVYYDKESKKKVEIKPPFYFAVIEDWNCITGFHEPTNSALYSNEVEYTKNTPFNIKSMKGDFALSGVWDEDFKDKVKAKGGKYTKSLYCFLWEDMEGEPELVNIKLSGATLSVWMNTKYSKENHVVEVTPEFTEFADPKGKKTTRYTPTFKLLTLSKEILESMISFDKEVLKPYLCSRS